MGQDYSYTQPSSSDEFDMTSLLQAEAEMYADEAESSFNIAEAEMYQPQPEADDGIPRTCYCGGEPAVATSYTAKDPGRRYYTCDVNDGDCHIWKWWDVAVTEEMSELQSQLRQLKDQGFESEEKLVKLQKTACELKKTVCELKKTVLRVMVSVLVFIGLAVMFLSGRASKNLCLSKSLSASL